MNGTQAPGSGFTALDRAANRGYTKVVRWSLDHGADPARGLLHGIAAVEAAQYRIEQSAEVAEMLRERLPQ